MESEKSPHPGEAIIKSDVGYHIRKGGHSVDPFDWEKILEFMDCHLMKR